MIEDFEFERRFFCNELPAEVSDGYPPQLIIQNYYLASDGYAIRIRATANGIKIKMTQNTDALEILENYNDAFDLAFITIKGPSIGGTRYELEHQLDISVALELIKRGGATIVKNRHWAWIGNDGWVVDQFGAQNAGLVIAEIERNEPVIDLEIPKFALLEITDDKRFSNDNLANTPYSAFREDFQRELATRQSQNPDQLYSNQFGENVLM